MPEVLPSPLLRCREGIDARGQLYAGGTIGDIGPAASEPAETNLNHS